MTSPRSQLRSYVASREDRKSHGERISVNGARWRNRRQLACFESRLRDAAPHA
jgi:hypothetical protein